ncbi:MAG: leucine--tRNA ligase [Flavobacteriales bacterium]|nr:leucine--tRNA ligase [Flavobacteriales bacterium]MCB9363723.1 leucine--tRNA ligase [Flavobacteriales bacterium]
MQYQYNEIEKNWQKYWAENKTFAAEDNSVKPKFYVLDMFPYPSGAGLHVGHPLGYIASDVYARYKRLCGFNVLHPMGYDSFGLPAEQYAIQTGQHPAITTKTNIEGGTDKDGNVIPGYRKQLDKIGFSFDWDREVRTSDPNYYKWTQWIFKQLFNSWYNKDADKAEKIETLIEQFKTEGNSKVNAVADDVAVFSAADWNSWSEEEQQKMLLNYRIAYLSDTWVNWCPALGTVLANDEIKDGVSERGGHPVEQKLMRQWSMRITAYAERLLSGLDGLDWTDSIKDIQRNWIGKSVGASVEFKVQSSKFKVEELETSNPKPETIEVFTTRPDTIFGVSFMVLAPEHELVAKITTDAQKEKIAAYQKAASLKSERDRMSDVKTISGEFTGAYAIHPFTGDKVPVWIGDYVLASYGTGAVMAVPCGDQRDWDFAKHFNIEIKNIFKDKDISEAAYAEKDAVIANSDFLNDLPVKKASKLAIYEIEKRGFGKGKTQYKLRDAVFSRQRYWGEPFPVYYKGDVPYLVNSDEVIKLPEVEKYLPTEDGRPPLGNAKNWHWDENNNKIVSVPVGQEPPLGVWGLELNTMPGWAGSSWYFLRYMDPKNDNEFVAKEKVDYWKNVDLYIGGAEHVTGHLLYSRFWTKFLYDLGYIPFEEPFQKMINQGMIQGNSALVYNFKKWTGLVDDDKRPCFPLENFPDVYISKNVLDLFNRKEKDLTRISKEKIDEAFNYNEEVRKYRIKIINQLREIEKRYTKKYKEDIEISKEFLVQCSYDENFITSKKIDINYLDGDNLDIERVSKDSRFSFLKEGIFILEDGSLFEFNSSLSGRSGGAFIVGREVDKMSKSKYNVVTPTSTYELDKDGNKIQTSEGLVEKYGADTLRCYEMFLGPLEQHKPWDTQGITGVNGFLKKLWRLFHTGENESFYVDTTPPSGEKEGAELKSLHKTIKKVKEDIERFSFNTPVSTFMICVNELTALKCNKKAILQDLLIILSPYAPHIAEELWAKLGNTESITYAVFPKHNEEYLVESNHKYPVSFNGKMRFMLELPANMSKDDVEAAVMANEQTVKYLAGQTPKKVIVVPKKIVNFVV